jgi:hypothetical protein
MPQIFRYTEDYTSSSFHIKTQTPTNFVIPLTLWRRKLIYVSHKDRVSTSRRARTSTTNTGRLMFYRENFEFIVNSHEEYIYTVCAQNERLSAYSGTFYTVTTTTMMMMMVMMMMIIIITIIITYTKSHRTNTLSQKFSKAIHPQHSV